MIAGKTTQDLIQIVSYGGGLDFNASSRTQQELTQIAGYAASKNCRVVMRGISHKTTQDLIQIASFGKGNVVFAD